METEIPSVPEKSLSQGLGSKGVSGSALAQYDFSVFSDRLRFLYSLLVGPSQSFEDSIQRCLLAGCQIFDAEQAMVLLEEGRVIPASIWLDNELGARSDLGSLSFDSDISQQLIKEAKTLCCTKFDPVDVNLEKVAYNDSNVVVYIGTPIVISSKIVGVLCFVSTLSRSEPFPSEDIETVELMAEGVAKMIELQAAKRKSQAIAGLTGFATEGIQTLEEYTAQARLPEAYGVAGRVVETLQRRISHMPLSIDCIAQDLNLSKRTLQRRLQQQEINFAQLRDQIRFHFSLDYLMEKNMSIDSISSSLDFSDRTSFTNAFKRWTGLSPSTFRKLFRDYT